MTRTQALKTARAQVGPLYVVGGEYAYRTYDSDRDAWVEGGTQPYAAARRSRSDAIKYRALVLSGVNPFEAGCAVYG